MAHYLYSIDVRFNVISLLFEPYLNDIGIWEETSEENDKCVYVMNLIQMLVASFHKLLSFSTTSYIYGYLMSYTLIKEVKNG